MKTLSEMTTTELIEADRRNSDEMELRARYGGLHEFSRNAFIRRRREIRAEIDRRKAQQS